jgi:hypothetical protein
LGIKRRPIRRPIARIPIVSVAVVGVSEMVVCMFVRERGVFPIGRQLRRRFWDQDGRRLGNSVVHYQGHRQSKERCSTSYDSRHTFLLFLKGSIHRGSASMQTSRRMHARGSE